MYHLDSVRLLGRRVPPPRRQHVPEEVVVHEATPGATGVLSVFFSIPTTEPIAADRQAGERGGANGKPRTYESECVAPGAGAGGSGGNERCRPPSSRLCLSMEPPVPSRRSIISGVFRLYILRTVQKLFELKLIALVKLL